MSNTLEVYNRILFLDLRPWLMTNVSELKFKQDLGELSKVHYQVQPNFELAFPKPLTNKRKYFQAQIDHEATGYLNDLHTAVSEAVNENEKKYHIHWALTRTLPQKLKELIQVISERGYSKDQFNHQPVSNNTNQQQADESFIIHYLKHQLVRLFMEVQESYPESLKEDPLNVEEIYMTYFNHTEPNPSYINEAVKIQVAKSIKDQETVQSAKPFKAIKEDIRAEAKGILPYSTIVKTATRFANFEEKLHENGYIDENYCFTDKHGLKTELATIYHHLINKSYFNQRQFPGNKEIKDVVIRKFLDHRYQTDLDKQFRTLKGNSDKVADFVDTHYWLSNLPQG